MISSSVYGGAGNDSISLVSASSGKIYGDNGADTITGVFTSAAVYGDNVGQSNADSFSFTTGASTSATVYGGGGNDAFLIGQAVQTSTLYGGAGVDTFSGTTQVTLSRVMGDGGADSIAFTNVDGSTVLGGDGADTIGTTAASYVGSSIVGGSGNDDFILDGAATGTSNTFYFGFGSGADTLTADAFTGLRQWRQLKMSSLFQLPMAVRVLLLLKQERTSSPSVLATA